MAGGRAATSASSSRQKPATAQTALTQWPKKPLLAIILNSQVTDTKRWIKDKDVALSDGQNLDAATKVDCQAALLRRYGMVTDAGGAAAARTNAGAAQPSDWDAKMKQVVTEAINQAKEQLVAPLAAKLPQIERRLDGLQAENVALRAEKKELHDSLSFISGQMEALQAQVSTLRSEQATATDAADIQLRKQNLMLSRLPNATDQASAKQMVSELLETVEVTAMPTEVMYYKPTYAAIAAASSSAGPPPVGRVRVSFASVQAKTSVFKAVAKLRNTPFHRTHLDDDLTPTQQAERRRQYPTYKRLLEEKKRPQWRGSQIFVDKKLYTTNTQRPPSGPLSADTDTARQPYQPETTSSPATPANASTAVTHTTPYTGLAPQASA